MSARGLSSDRLEHLDDVLRGHVEQGDIPGLAWLVSRGGDIHTGAAGTLTAGGNDPVAEDTIFRIASMSKPVSAVAALVLVEACVLRLDEPVDRWLPELADRQVMVRSDGPLDETVPADRAITVRDLLTFRLGWGMDFTAWDRQPVLAAMAELGLGIGPPTPAGPPPPDEWISRLGTLPLERQPGQRWLYHIGADVLGVLIARAAGQPLEAFLRERIFDPLGMRDTGFAVPAGELPRFGACYTANPDTGARELYDPADGQWSTPPAFPSAGGGLVSTVPDFQALAEMLLAGGIRHGERILSRPSVEAMTTDHLTDEQRDTSSPDPSGAVGWGFGVGVQVRRTGPARTVGTYGWDGGLGSSWANDPAEGLVGIVLTNQAFTSPTPPPTVADFWTCAYAAIDD